jgi:hypothetical protein
MAAPSCMADPSPPARHPACQLRRSSAALPPTRPVTPGRQTEPADIVLLLVHMSARQGLPCWPLPGPCFSQVHCCVAARLLMASNAVKSMVRSQFRVPDSRQPTAPGSRGPRHGAPANPKERHWQVGCAALPSL